MGKQKEITALAVKRLSKVIPAATLELQRKEIDTIVKATPDNDLHVTFAKAKGFFSLFADSVKEEFTKRAKKLLEKGEKIETDVGSITFVSRSNFSFDEVGILDFLKSKKLNEELIYDYQYTVNTKDARILADLFNKGIIVIKKALNKEKFNELATEHQKLLDFVEDKPTEYVKGL